MGHYRTEHTLGWFDPIAGFLLLGHSFDPTSGWNWPSCWVKSYSCAA